MWFIQIGAPESPWLKKITLYASYITDTYRTGHPLPLINEYLATPESVAKERVFLVVIEPYPHYSYFGKFVVIPIPGSFSPNLSLVPFVSKVQLLN